jgi:hypothetical protein
VARCVFGLLMAALMTLSACGGRQASGSTAPERDAESTLTVENLGFADATVYAVTGTGSRVRLGLVNGNSTQRLTLPGYLVRGGDQLRFLADPIGGSQGPVTEELFVGPGDNVVLTIPPR